MAYLRVENWRMPQQLVICCPALREWQLHLTVQGSVRIWESLTQCCTTFQGKCMLSLIFSMPRRSELCFPAAKSSNSGNLNIRICAWSGRCYPTHGVPPNFRYGQVRMLRKKTLRSTEKIRCNNATYTLTFVVHQVVNSAYYLIQMPHWIPLIAFLKPDGADAIIHSSSLTACTISMSENLRGFGG